MIWLYAQGPKPPRVSCFAGLSRNWVYKLVPLFGVAQQAGEALPSAGQGGGRSSLRSTVTEAVRQEP